MIQSTKRKTPVTGVVATFIVTAFFIGSGYTVFMHSSGPDVYTVEDMQRNERSAFENIRLVSKAQAEYIKQDRDFDGVLEYSTYVTHLWRTIGPDSQKIQLDLIPKDLAYAIKPSHAINGYVFVHQFKKTSKTGQEADLDREKEWGVLMVPAVLESGRITFFADESGTVYANGGRTQRVIPDAPETDDAWVPLSSLQDLVKLQQGVQTQDSTP